MKVLSVVGARPQFVKAAVVSRALSGAGIEEILVHSGQHYDENMSSVFFDEMEIPRPDVDLEVGSGGHATQTGLTMQRLDPLVEQHAPDVMIIYGDTNTTLAAALVGAKRNTPVAHVEAGLRSFDMSMPEEINRVAADRVSSLLFCPTDTAVDNLHREGMVKGVHLTGDVMYDAVLFYRDKASRAPSVHKRLDIPDRNYVLATIHRDFNTDNPTHLKQIVEVFAASSRPVLFPAHPRTRKAMASLGFADTVCGSLRVLDPVGYLEMVQLEMNAALIVTDSGGVQKEAYFHKVPCLTVRPSTEWVELVHAGWNRLVPADKRTLLDAMEGTSRMMLGHPDFYGNGRAGGRIAAILLEEGVNAG